MLLPLSTSGEISGFQDPKLSLPMMNEGTKKAPASGQGTPDVQILHQPFRTSVAPSPNSVFSTQARDSHVLVQSILKPLSVSTQANSVLSVPAPSSHRKHLIMTSKSQIQKTTKSNSFSLCFTFLDIAYKLVFYNFTLLEIQALKHSVFSAFLLSLHSPLNP